MSNPRVNKIKEKQFEQKRILSRKILFLHCWNKSQNKYNMKLQKKTSLKSFKMKHVKKKGNLHGILFQKRPHFISKNHGWNWLTARTFLVVFVLILFEHFFLPFRITSHYDITEPVFNLPQKKLFSKITLVTKKIFFHNWFFQKRKQFICSLTNFWG